ncbi:hypothetical protein C0J52_12080 [Blattella germanica]|nr:hypothetical protein C0J52_12080 [Blattella germanica]
MDNKLLAFLLLASSACVLSQTPAAPATGAAAGTGAAAAGNASNETEACPKILSKEEWGGRAPLLAPEETGAPLPYIVVHHGGTKIYCNTQDECSRIVRSYQDYHMDTHNWNDIGYNFIIGEDGNVYEGRGWNIVGAHAPTFNDRSIGICIIGDFTASLRIISRQEWGGREPNGTWDKQSQTPQYIVVHHGGSKRYCTSQDECSSVIRAYQNYHMDHHGWGDIGYNALVGEDGNAYMG